MVIHQEYKKVTSRDTFLTQTCVVLYHLQDGRNTSYILVEQILSDLT